MLCYTDGWSTADGHNLSFSQKVKPTFVIEKPQVLIREYNALIYYEKLLLYELYNNPKTVTMKNVAVYYRDFDMYIRIEYMGAIWQ